MKGKPPQGREENSLAAMKDCVAKIGAIVAVQSERFAKNRGEPLDMDAIGKEAMQLKALTKKYLANMDLLIVRLNAAKPEEDDDA